IGAARVQEYVDRASRGEDLTALLAADPELAGVDLAELLDPTRYLGAADALIDVALASLAAPAPRHEAGS
ncbi:MAG: 3-carboxy-cis,cis-muconate cycloisomerase, partial [Actinomycetota bacterium]|nr:3-carboxy-cis,cis-muconate cycloisomerase [Actinomycetota bacterium]